MSVVAWVLATAAVPPCLGSSDVRSKAVRCDSVEYQYLLFSPASVQPLPAILLLHGAGDYPPNFIAAWKSFAKQKHIILIAPELPRIDTFERVAPAVFKCVVEDTKMQAAIDPRRVYVVGHSMGGILPMTLPPSIPNTSPQSLSTPWGLPMNTNQS
jgi:poly(3-hydroxybutyrate) depolymerase